MTRVLAGSALAELASHRVNGLAPATDVAVLRADVTPEAGYQQTRSNRQTTTFEVRSEDVAEPKRLDTLTIGAQVWVIGDPPTFDPVTESWHCNCYLEVEGAE